MSCNCIDNSEAKMLEHIKSKGDVANYCELKNKTLTLGLGSVLSLTYEVDIVKKVKGIEKNVKTKIKAIPAFCPFCGVEYEDKK